MNILVTGGTGFIGKALVKELLRKGHSVSVFALDRDDELDKLKVPQTAGDICDNEAVRNALEGIDAVFHTAARTGTAGRYRDFHRPNVTGTEKLLNAAKKAGVRYFIYTGSPSAVFCHKPIEGLSEDECSYPRSFRSYYEKTKALAEQLVIIAGKTGNGNLRTIIVRPHLVYGPGDTNLLPRLEARAATEKLAQVGDGTNLVSLTHISNAVQGHIRAMESLALNEKLSGNCYFITDKTPVNLWNWIRDYLDGKKLPGPVRTISYKTAYFLGGVFEAIWKILPIRRSEPPLTRFVADQFAMSHYYSIDKAMNELGYEPGTDLSD